MEVIGYFNSVKKTQAEIKFPLSEIKKNLWGTSDGVNETKNQMTDLEYKEEWKNIQSEHQEEKIIQKTKSLWDIFKCTNIWIIEVPKGEEEDQEIENLLEKNERKLP